MHILVTINKNYIYPLIIMLYSYLKNNPYITTVYIMNKDLEQEDIFKIERALEYKLKIVDIKINDQDLQKAPVSKRFPITMYYRLFAWKYLPENIDKVLYLDPDIIINKDITDLYQLNLDTYAFAAASHVGKFVSILNALRLKMNYKGIYINSGVILMNLKELRNLKIDEKIVYDYIKKLRNFLFLPDQDLLSKLYSGKIKEIDTCLYNFTEKMSKKYSVEWIEKYTKIIHYCGRGKPWIKKSKGKLKPIYIKYENEWKNRHDFS